MATLPTKELKVPFRNEKEKVTLADFPGKMPYGGDPDLPLQIEKDGEGGVKVNFFFQDGNDVYKVLVKKWQKGRQLHTWWPILQKTICRACENEIPLFAPSWNPKKEIDPSISDLLHKMAKKALAEKDGTVELKRFLTAFDFLYDEKLKYSPRLQKFMTGKHFARVASELIEQHGNWRFRFRDVVHKLYAGKTYLPIANPHAVDGFVKKTIKSGKKEDLAKLCETVYNCHVHADHGNPNFMFDRFRRTSYYR